MMIAKILIIDDEVKALALLKTNLEDANFEVHTANNGVEGVIRAIQIIPDLIILDVRMPELDGWDVCKRLKSTASTKDIPIVFLTAFSSDKDREKAKTLGAAEYLTKPIDPEKLLNILRDILLAKITEQSSS
jgi:DNA-binding response OmpR family regulator